MGSYLPNDDSELEDLVPEDVLQRSRCALCRRYLSCAPLLVLQKIGTICGRCCPPPDNQPIFRNKAAEQLLSWMDFPCSFWERGCKKKDQFNVILQHEDQCMFQCYYCPFVSCTWKGPPLEVRRHMKKHEDMWTNQVHPCYLESCSWTGIYARRWEHFEKDHAKYVLEDNEMVLDTSKDFLAEYFGKILEVEYGILLHFNATKKVLSYSVYHPTRKNLQCFCSSSNYAQHDCFLDNSDETLKIAGADIPYYREFLLDLKVSVYYYVDQVSITVNFRSAEMPD